MVLTPSVKMAASRDNNNVSSKWNVCPPPSGAGRRQPPHRDPPPRRLPQHPRLHRSRLQALVPPHLRPQVPLPFPQAPPTLSPRLLPLWTLRPYAATAPTSYSLGGTEDATVLIRDCRNGSVYSLLCKRGSGVTGGVHKPLCQDRAVAAIPPLSHPNCTASRILSKEEESGGLSYMYVTLGPPFKRTCFTVFMLQDGVWCMHMSVTAQICCRFERLQAVLVENKIYLTATMSDIIVLDLTTSSMSTIQLPQGVEYITSATILSRADDASGVYLIQVDLELRIWLHSGENWSLVDTICYREMVANLRMSDCTVDHENTADVHISQVGDNAEFAFLQMGRCTFYLDIKCRTLRKVHERKHWDPFEQIYPFMMIWLPTFPTLKDDFARDAV